MLTGLEITSDLYKKKKEHTWAIPSIKHTVPKYGNLFQTKADIYAVIAVEIFF